VSSASRPSDAAVKPTRSAKRTDTSRRSAAGAEAGGGVAGAGEPASAVPHSPQNLTPGAFGVPHDGQAVDSGLPHSPQNLRPASFADAQAGHDRVSGTCQL
jgi:hypothetical protein